MLESDIAVGFTGAIGAGKTTGALYVSERYALCYVRYSAVLAEWTSNDSEDKGVLQAEGERIMSGGMQMELNRRLIAGLGRGKSYAIDGLRHQIDEKSLRGRFGSRFFLVYVDSAERSRWKRVALMGRFNDYEAFLDADRRSVEMPLRELRETSFVVIQNEGTLSEYQGALDVVVARIRESSLGGTI